MGLSGSGGAGLALLCVFFFGIGIVTLGWPEKVQGWMVSFHEGASGLAKWNPFINWIRTSSYIISLRIVGILAIVAGCVVLFALIKPGDVF